MHAYFGAEQVRMDGKMRETILEGRELVKTFGDTRVLQGINLKLYADDFTVIMGSSGSGKSTLLSLLGGMDRPSGGQLFYHGNVDMACATEKELTDLRAGAFGFVFQRTYLVSSLTLAENIRMAGLIGSSLPEEKIAEKTEELIRRMRLEKAKDRLPAQVSGGEAQRAAVARAVITKPTILFADEPTGALNKANSKEVLNLLSALHTEGQTILMVTHDREAALRGNRILYLEDGVIVGEMEIGPYQGKDSQREQKLAVWLEEMEW